MPTNEHNLWAPLFVCIAKQHVRYFMLDQCLFLKIRYNVQSMKLYCCKDFKKHELIGGQMDKYVDKQSYVWKEERQLILWPN